jgi:hypothetical protein
VPESVQLFKQVENHCNTFQVDSEVPSKPIDRTQARNDSRVKEQDCILPADRFNQTEIYELQNLRGMNASAQGHYIQSQFPRIRRLSPIHNRNHFGSRHHFPSAINWRASKRDSAASFSNNSLSFDVGFGGMTIFNLTYSSPRPPCRLVSP